MESKTELAVDDIVAHAEQLETQQARENPADASQLAEEERDYSYPRSREKHQSEALKLRHDFEKGLLNGIQAENAQRSKVLHFVLNLVRWWIIVILVALVFHAFAPAKIGDNVMIALLGTVSLNIIGLAATVAKYLFPNSGSNQSDLLCKLLERDFEESIDSQSEKLP